MNECVTSNEISPYHTYEFNPTLECSITFEVLSSNVLSYSYDFDRVYEDPTMGDILGAKHGHFGEPTDLAQSFAWWGLLDKWSNDKPSFHFL
jgi:hypothetical protein